MSALQLEFRRWRTPTGLAPSVVFDGDPGPGIYVLEFADGTEYVGQSLHPVSRLATHRRRWADIVAVRFASVPKAELNRVEQEHVTERRRAGIHLRNKTLLAQPFGESVLDSIVTQGEQAAWIDTDPRRGDIHVAPERIEEARFRLSSEPDRLPREMRQHPSFDDALTSLAAYIYNVIPEPAETEGRGWVLSAWPSTGRTRSRRRFSTLSIQNVELIFLCEERLESGEWVQYTVLNVAETLHVPTDLTHVATKNRLYRTVGPVWTFDVDGWDSLPALLSYPALLVAARELVLGQLRKGRAMFSRFHSEALADECFAVIGETGNDTGPATLPV